MTVPAPPDRPESQPAATPEDTSTPARPESQPAATSTPDRPDAEPGRPETVDAPASATETEPGSEPEPVADSGAKSESEPESVADSGGGSESVAESGAGADSESGDASVPEAVAEYAPRTADAPAPVANPWAVPPPAPKSAPTPEPTPATATAPTGGPAPVTNPWAVPNPNAAPPPIHPAMSGPVPGPFPGAVPPHVPPHMPPHVPAPNGMYWGPYPAPVPQPRNGIGVAALVLGIVSVVLCLPLILFWFAWLPAVLAVIFGCVGLSLARKRQATNRAMALTGTALGAVGLLASVVTGGLLISDLASSDPGQSFTVGVRDDSEEQRQADKQSQQAADEQAKKKAEKEAAKQADEKARHLSFGGSYTYPDGLKVTMAEPTATTPVKSAGSPLPQDATFVRLQVTVVNTSPTELSLYGSGLLIVKDSNDALLYPLFGGGQYQGLPKSLSPGQEATAVETYGLPNASSDPFTLRFTHGPDLRDVTWAGSPPR